MTLGRIRTRTLSSWHVLLRLNSSPDLLCLMAKQVAEFLQVVQWLSGQASQMAYRVSNLPDAVAAPKTTSSYR